MNKVHCLVALCNLLIGGLFVCLFYDTVVLRGHNWVHFAHLYCYPEFKLSYLKNLKLFSIRIKEMLEPIVLRNKCDGFLLFLKAFSWETDLWVTLGDFTVKNPKLRREICI